jgi:Zn-dependent alcohol dehydrogenase
MESGALDVASAITKVRPLDEVNAALDDLRAGAVVRTVLRP